MKNCSLFVQKLCAKKGICYIFKSLPVNIFLKIAV